jgi:4'-phosphopantetheinyl transferase
MPLVHGHVDLWIARDARLRDAAWIERWWQSLTPEERARVEGMHFPEHRHQQLVTRGMLREVLSRYAPAVAPQDWRFERNEHGRPRVVPGADATTRDLQFNLAHTRGLVVLAVGRTPTLGVDVEHSDQRAPLQVARRYFSAPEIASLDALPAADRPQRFRRLWTLKESYLKAIGTGVVGGLDTMTFHFEPCGLRFESAADPDATRWQFREFEIPEGYLLALACLDREVPGPMRVTLRDFPPRPLVSGEEQRAES